MPKERKDRSVSHDRYRGSPLCCESSRALKPSDKQVKEWEEARCPVCMEHPHNGILLVCSSYENGCRPYMCDTSHRHSNCFDQFRKASKEEPSLSLPHELEESSVPTETENVASDSTAVNLGEEAASEVTVVNLREGENGEGLVEEEIVATDDDNEKSKPPKLTCPLCRGHIKEWVVVEPARCFMNSKHRSCSCETCDFSGTYSDLRKHARVQHPGVRPSEADPERQRSWRRLERQRDLGDLISTLQSSFGGEERSTDDLFDDGGWLTVFLLIRVFRPESSGPRSSWSGASRARSQIGGRRRSSRPSRLWGESYEGSNTGTSSRDEEDNQSSDEQESGTRRRRVRRRAFIDDDDDEEEQ
ncbi:hypothetical protein CARUB_v10019181mg [Capsella rubella]|uniref:Uncharacterized protein n=1 Tax=Capsella rubella TaxID=81985 RepID=R0HPC1_9BRAS|nr:uncharacterized protein LOC17887356 [Capsella rubella]XP_023637903.1 uncharacterized protein LOC17887356 [Capsella rubella]XP_023637904.1 uncharacterized protein LOC17887356 [Capsella rubella]EOA25813.1 hypothetical protein CARUB_v10019181mg [Capsella rubella]